MATSIGPRIGIDGYAQYKAEMQSITAQIEQYKAKCDALGNSAEDLRKKEQLLSEAIKLQTDAIMRQAEWNQRVNEYVDKKARITDKDTAALTQNKTAIVTQETELNKLTAEYDKTTQAIGNIGNETEKMQNRVSGATIAIGELMAKLIEKAVELGKRAAEIGINYNASMETAQAALTTLLGDSEQASAALEKVKELSKIAPTFSTETLLKASQMIIATGKSADEATNDVYALANAVAAAGGSNDTLLRMAQNLQQIGNAGKSTAIDIRQFAYAGLSIYPLLADYMGITAEEASKLKPTYEQITGALKYAAGEGGKYYKGIENQAKTYNGQVSALKKNLQEGLGYAFQEVTQKLESSVIPKLNEFLSDTSNIDKATEAFKTFGATVATVAAAGKITNFLSGSSTLAELLTGKITLASAAMAAVPFAEVIAGIAAITASYKALKDEVNTVKTVGFLGEGKTIDEYTANVDSYKEKIKELEEEYKTLAENGADLTEIDIELTNARIGLTHAEEELAEATKEANEQIEKAIETESQSDPTARYDAIISNAKDTLSGLKQAYDEYYEAAQKAVAKEFELFEEVGKLEYTSTESLGKNLQSQTDYWQAYAVNLELVRSAQSGLSQELISFLADGSKESAGYLASIVSDVMQAGGFTSEEGQAIIANLNQKFADLQAAQTTYATETATALSDIGNQMNTTVDEAKTKLQELDLSEEMYNEGISTLNGYVSGLQAQIPSLNSQAFTWGQNLTVQMQSGVNSVQLTLPRLSLGSPLRIPGFAKGLDYVPRDNYIAALHKGEMVLTAAQANRVRSGEYQQSISNTANLGGVSINVYAAEGMNEDALAEKVSDRLQQLINEQESIYR